MILLRRLVLLFPRSYNVPYNVLSSASFIDQLSFYTWLDQRLLIDFFNLQSVIESPKVMRRFRTVDEVLMLTTVVTSALGAAGGRQAHAFSVPCVREGESHIDGQYTQTMWVGLDWTVGMMNRSLIAIRLILAVTYFSLLQEIYLDKGSFFIILWRNNMLEYSWAYL